MRRQRFIYKLPSPPCRRIGVRWLNPPPRLWTTTLINVKPKTIELKTELLKLYLKNVRGVPFPLELNLLHRTCARMGLQGGLRTMVDEGLRFKIFVLGR